MKLKTSEQKPDHHQKRLGLLSFITNILSEKILYYYISVDPTTVDVHAAFLLKGTGEMTSVIKKGGCSVFTLEGFFRVCRFSVFHPGSCPSIKHSHYCLLGNIKP